MGELPVIFDCGCQIKHERVIARHSPRMIEVSLYRRRRHRVTCREYFYIWVLYHQVINLLQAGDTVLRRNLFDGLAYSLRIGAADNRLRLVPVGLELRVETEILPGKDVI